MTEWQAQIHLSDKVYRTIKWFTKNFDNEIGAIGIGEVRGGLMYVEKLFFPTQIVNGAHVHFKPEDWGPLMTEMKDDEWQKVLFYWHKHPDGSAKASPGDEEDTIDVFMDETSGRKTFGFLQTCMKDDKMDYEARIELREPIWTTISDVAIVTDEDNKIEKYCQKVIKDKVTKGTASASQQPGWSGAYNNNDPYKTSYDSPAIKTPCTRTIGSPPIKLGNTCSSNMFTKLRKKMEEEYGVVFDVEKKNGNIKVQVSLNMEDWIATYIERPDLKQKIAKVDKKDQSNETVLFNIQPKKKCLDEMYKAFKGVEEYFWSAQTNKYAGQLQEILDEEDGDHDVNPDSMFYKDSLTETDLR